MWDSRPQKKSHQAAIASSAGLEPSPKFREVPEGTKRTRFLSHRWRAQRGRRLSLQLTRTHLGESGSAVLPPLTLIPTLCVVTRHRRWGHARSNFDPPLVTEAVIACGMPHSRPN